MIRCLPTGVCSWNFIVEGAGHQASLEFNWFSESGVITVDGNRFEVIKNGMLSGEWSLARNGVEIARADKISVFKRTFIIQRGLDEHILKPASPLGRRFVIERGYEHVARIAPDHAFTRRATINVEAQQYDHEIVFFAFWLVVLMWRRAASNS